MHFVTYKYVDIGENFGRVKPVIPSDNNSSDTARDIRKIRNVYIKSMYISSDHNKIIKTSDLNHFLSMNIVLFLNIYWCIYLSLSLNVKCV